MIHKNCSKIAVSNAIKTNWLSHLQVENFLWELVWEIFSSFAFMDCEIIIVKLSKWTKEHLCSLLDKDIWLWLIVLESFGLYIGIQIFESTKIPIMSSTLFTNLSNAGKYKSRISWFYTIIWPFEKNCSKTTILVLPQLSYILFYVTFNYRIMY